MEINFDFVTNTKSFGVHEEHEAHDQMCQDSVLEEIVRVNDVVMVVIYALLIILKDHDLGYPVD